MADQGTQTRNISGLPACRQAYNLSLVSAAMLFPELPSTGRIIRMRMLRWRIKLRHFSPRDSALGITSNITDSFWWIWEQFWTWRVIATIALLFYGLGVNAMYGNDFIIAASFYFVAIVLVTTKLWSQENLGAHPNSAGIRFFAILIGTFVFAASLLWINHRKGHVVISKIKLPTQERTKPIQHPLAGEEMPKAELQEPPKPNLRVPAASNMAASPSLSPIEGLSELGWTVQPGTTEIQFEIASKPLPDMRASARYFRALHKPFRLHFQSVKGIVGLHFLADIGECKKIEINGGQFSDISELRGFTGLTRLGISQTPINAVSTVDSSPLSSLVGLRELNLYGTRITDLGPIAELAKLTTLGLKGTLVRDLSPVVGLTSLESIDVTETAIVDLSALAEAASLRELGIDGKQIPGLVKLTHLEHLKTLRIIDQGNVDLSAVGQLTGLESLDIWGPPVFNLSPLRTLTKLRKLQISGLGMGLLSAVTGVDALGDLRDLRQLTLGYVQIGDLTFVSNLGRLNEINIAVMPVSSVEPLRGLSSLQSVSLSQTNIVDISPLLGLPQLKKLSVQGSPVRSDVLTELERRGVKVQR